MPSLGEAMVRNAKPRNRAYKLYDERGLFLLVAPNGTRMWRFRYQIGEREKQISLGLYPDVPLKRAREKRDEARRMVADEIDPSLDRKARRAAMLVTFEGVAQEWLELQSKSLSPETISILGARLNSGLYPYLGSRPIGSITALEVLGALRRIEARGRHETAHRVRALAGRVFRYAVATGRAKHDVAADLRDALAPVRSKNFASIVDPMRVGELMRAIHGYSGHPMTALALKLTPLLFVRPGELRQAEWAEIDLEGAEWRIPATRMKMKELHVVPLARQAVALFEELQPLARGGRYVFHSLRTRDRPMSNNTINAALRRLGYSGEEQTAHGFRTMASTLLNEQGYHPDVIELQLAHAERNRVRAAYNKAQRMPERRQMMQAWADYLGQLRAGAKVVPIRREHRAS